MKKKGTVKQQRTVRKKQNPKGNGKKAGVKNPNAQKKNPEYYWDIYDRIAKRCLSISPGCTVSLINGLFGTDYPADSKVTYNWTENVDDGLKKTLADTIVMINGTSSYHCEFQMRKEGDMVLRVFEYDINYARRSCKGDQKLVLPKSVVVYLYDEPVPEAYSLYIYFDEQMKVEYKMPVYSYLKETGENPAERDKLIVLLPFQLLRLRRAIEEERTEENIEALKKIITHDIVEVLEKNVAEKKITPVDEQEILILVSYLYDHIYGKYAKEMSEVSEMINGALKLPGDAFLRKIREQEEQIADMKEQHKEQIADKDEQIAEKEEQIAALKRQLAALQK